MTETGLEFRILVIVICLIFVICYLEFLVLLYSSRLAQGGKSMEAPSGGSRKPGPLGPDSLLNILITYGWSSLNPVTGS